MVGALKSKWRTLAVVGVAISPLLSACGGGETVGEALGYGLSGPDEMAVIKRPPLTVPPDFNLRPPRSGDDAAQARDASNAARQTLLGTTAGSGENQQPTSDGQNLLISRSDRTELDLDKLAETRAENRVDGALLRRLLAWNPEDQGAGTADGADGDGVGSKPIEVVSRSQTVIDATADADTENAE
ncbi:MAG: DUF3035 domain-containing protein [Pseudomonadota bacterium]